MLAMTAEGWWLLIGSIVAGVGAMVGGGMLALRCRRSEDRRRRLAFALGSMVCGAFGAVALVFAFAIGTCAFSSGYGH